MSQTVNNHLSPVQQRQLFTLPPAKRRWAVAAVEREVQKQTRKMGQQTDPLSVTAMFRGKAAETAGEHQQECASVGLWKTRAALRRGRLRRSPGHFLDTGKWVTDTAIEVFERKTVRQTQLN